MKIENFSALLSKIDSDNQLILQKMETIELKIEGISEFSEATSAELRNVRKQMSIVEEGMLGHTLFEGLSRLTMMILSLRNDMVTHDYIDSIDKP